MDWLVIAAYYVDAPSGDDATRLVRDTLTVSNARPGTGAVVAMDPRLDQHEQMVRDLARFDLTPL